MSEAAVSPPRESLYYPDLAEIALPGGLDRQTWTELNLLPLYTAYKLLDGDLDAFTASYREGMSVARDETIVLRERPGLLDRVLAIPEGQRQTVQKGLLDERLTNNKLLQKAVSGRESLSASFERVQSRYSGWRACLPLDANQCDDELGQLEDLLNTPFVYSGSRELAKPLSVTTLAAAAGVLFGFACMPALGPIAWLPAVCSGMGALAGAGVGGVYLFDFKQYCNDRARAVAYLDAKVQEVHLKKEPVVQSETVRKDWTKLLEDLEALEEVTVIEE